MRSTPITLIIAALLIGITPSGPARAAGVVGTGTAASCTEAALRAVLSTGGEVSFSCGPAMHTIMLSDDLLISKDTTIDGGGPQQGGLITLSGGGRTRVLVTAGMSRLVVRNLTISEGKEAGDDGRGGAIRGGWRSPVTVINSVLRDNDGTAGGQEGGGGAIFVHETRLLVQTSRFERNRGINGGAINNLLSAMTVEDSLFIDNDATPGGPLRGGYGGAIYTDGATWPIDDALGDQIIIRRSQFIGNQGSGQGGAVFSFVYPPDSVLIEGVLFKDNRLVYNAACYADGSCDALGGALRHGNGALTLRDSTFVGNQTQAQGGAFWTDGRYPGELSNLTFVNNRAVADQASGKGGLGGAIAGSGNWSCNGCTFAANHAGFVGGAIFGGGAPNTSLKNSLFVANSAYNDGRGWNKNQSCASQYADGGGNVQYPAKNPSDASDTNCAAAVLIADPLLGPLGSYGGNTPTMPLLDGSPAEGRGGACLTTDQRGVARSASSCDSGAYEVGMAPVLLTVVPSLLAQGAPVSISLSGADFGPDSVLIWGDSVLPTSYQSRLSLSSTVTPSTLGAVSVRVRRGDQTSAPITVQVVAALNRVALPLLRRR